MHCTIYQKGGLNKMIYKSIASLSTLYLLFLLFFNNFIVKPCYYFYGDSRREKKHILLALTITPKSNYDFALCNVQCDCRHALITDCSTEQSTLYFYYVTALLGALNDKVEL